MPGSGNDSENASRFWGMRWLPGGADPGHRDDGRRANPALIVREIGGAKSSTFSSRVHQPGPPACIESGYEQSEDQVECAARLECREYDSRNHHSW